MTPDVRSLLEDSLSDIPQQPAVALSGGIDSTSVLFALQELDKDPRAYTFHVEGHESTDLRISRDVCRTFDVPFTPVELPTDLATIKQDTYSIINGLGYRSKTDIECIWPFMYLLPEINEQALATGSCADGHFVISREAMLNGIDKSVDRMDKFRSDLFGDPDYAQIRMVEKLAAQYGIPSVRVPYYTREFVSAFMGTAWDEINKPKQKQPIIDAYPDKFSKIKVRSHTNLQCGDSKIQDQFEKLVDSTWNINDWKSQVGIYNAIARGDVP
jgi:asparagine synthetase B (glutamine-hydrolysing)